MVGRLILVGICSFLKLIIDGWDPLGNWPESQGYRATGFPICSAKIGNQRSKRSWVLEDDLKSAGIGGFSPFLGQDPGVEYPLGNWL